MVSVVCTTEFESMDENFDDGMWLIDSGEEGASLCISVGARGDERLPVEAVTQLASMFATDELGVTDGRLLLVIGNIQAVAVGVRHSTNGVDLDTCYGRSVLSRPPVCHEERRAREIVRRIEEAEIDIVVDFRSPIADGGRFLVQRSDSSCPRHLEVTDLLRADTVVADPARKLPTVGLADWMVARDGVGVRYETGREDDPEMSPRFVRDEMINLMAGLGMILGRAYQIFPEATRLQVADLLRVERDGFRWRDGVGEELQSLPAGAVLGSHDDGSEVALGQDSVLVYPRQAPETLERGDPLVSLATRSA